MILSSLSRGRGRTRRVLWSITIAVTILMGFGASRIRVETGLIDWLPVRHPNVRAFVKLFERLEGAVNQELIWLEIDPDKAERLGDRAMTIDSRTSFAAQEELIRYLRSRVGAIRDSFGISSLRGTLASLGLTPDVAWQVLRRNFPELVESVTASDPKVQGTILTLIIDAAPLSAEGRRIARDLEAALQAYREDDSVQYDLFRHEYLVSTGMASGTAVLDRTLRDELLRLTPIALLAVILILRLSLGSWRALLVVSGVLALGTLWTLGLMGLLGTPVNIITFSLIPLVLGCGIDYAILVSFEALDRRTAGTDIANTLQGVRRISTVPIVLTTLTTVAGLLTLTFSESPGMISLGLHGAAGMLGLAFLTLLLLPDLMARVRPSRSSRFGPVIAPIATSFARNRRIVLIVAAIATFTAAILARRPVFLLDVIQGNYPADSPIARSVERMGEMCGGAFPEVIIADGDLSSPRALETLAAIKRDIESSEVLKDSFRVVAATDILGLYSLVAGKSFFELASNLASGRFEPEASLPKTADAIKKEAREVYDDPHWASLAGAFFDRDLTIGTILLLAGDAGRDMDSVSAVWNELERILRLHRSEDSPLELSFLGYRTMAYLFASYSESWIYRTMIVSVCAVLALAAIFLRELRAVFAIAVLLVLGGVWWLAALEFTGIHVSIFLLFPLVFAMCIGSDYGLHMLCRIRSDRRALGKKAEELSPVVWTRSAWSTTGRAIAIAALTDGLVFFIYSRMSLVSASQVMLAACLAVAAVFGCTIFLLPALAFPRSPRSESRSPPAPQERNPAVDDSATDDPAMNDPATDDQGDVPETSRARER